MFLHAKGSNEEKHIGLRDRKPVGISRPDSVEQSVN